MCLLVGLLVILLLSHHLGRHVAPGADAAGHGVVLRRAQQPGDAQVRDLHLQSPFEI